MTKLKDRGQPSLDSYQADLVDSADQAAHQDQTVSGMLIRRPIWIDVLVFIFIAAALYCMIKVAGSFTAPRRQIVPIDLSIRALPKYAMLSLFRGFAAYFISLTFTLVYGYIAAKNRRAQKVMIPLLDVLQSIPVLGFMPGLILAMIALFPNTNFGLEIAAILMIFTGQVWNMTFSFYYSLRSIPRELAEAAQIYHFSWWRRFTTLELPHAAMGLVYNSMMGMAGGWFFLTVCETFPLGDQGFTLPGIGSYMTAAIGADNLRATLYGIATMAGMIVAIDQLLWRPLIAWAQKFKYEETAAGEAYSSTMLDLLRRSAIVGFVGWAVNRMQRAARQKLTVPLPPAAGNWSSQTEPKKKAGRIGKIVSWTILAALMLVGAYGSIKLLGLLVGVELGQWLEIGAVSGLTLTRVMAAMVLGSLWAVPAGILIGLSTRASKVLQPLMQVLASFPAPMLYPIIMKAMGKLDISLEFGAVLLLMLGTQWYILFNAAAGAMGIPHQLKQVTAVYKFSRWRRWTRLYLPAVFPSLITGWVAAAGGAWNATIVAEYVTVGQKVFSARGLGAIITQSTRDGDFPVLAAAVMVMALLVVCINRFLWRPMHLFARTRFSLVQ